MTRAGSLEIVPGIAMAAPLEDADALLAGIAREIEVSDELVDEGRGPVATRRQTAWYGDPGATYSYGGITRFPRPWTPTLAILRDRLGAALDVALNSCLVGVYGDGSRNVDWHADDEPELRDRIVSVSLGAQRTFLLRAKAASETIAVPLAHGSVLVMSVASQLRWEHAVPAEPVREARINLTFRSIVRC